MTPQEFTRLACEYVPSVERTPAALYVPVAVLMLELNVAVRDDGNMEGVVVPTVGAVMRRLLTPAMLLGVNAPQPDWAKLEKLWTRPVGKVRYLSAMRDAQLYAASYVTNAISLGSEPALKARRLKAMSAEMQEIAERLAIVVAHHGYTLAQAARWDLEALAARAGAPLEVAG